MNETIEDLRQQHEQLLEQVVSEQVPRRRSQLAKKLKAIFVTALGETDPEPTHASEGLQKLTARLRRVERELAKLRTQVGSLNSSEDSSSSNEAKDYSESWASAIGKEALSLVRPRWPSKKGPSSSGAGARRNYQAMLLLRENPSLKARLDRLQTRPSLAEMNTYERQALEAVFHELASYLKPDVETADD